MRILQFIFLLAISTSIYAQTAEFNKWSVGLNVGMHDGLRPVLNGTKVHQIHHYGANVRYMMNNSSGLMLDFGYDFLDFYGLGTANTHYVRTNIQGVGNVGHVLHFEEWTKRFGLLVHGGFGMSHLFGKDTADYTDTRLFKKSDDMVNLTFGISPQFKINERIALTGDISMINNIRQNVTFDMTSPITGMGGIRGSFYNASIGIQFYIGKNERHADWVPSGIDMSEIEKLNQRIDTLKQGRIDDDKDGVPNYMDQEPASAEGSKVDHKGITIKPADQRDTDSDGVMDAVDLCPEMKGSIEANGCPDGDGDGVPDILDACPNDKGMKSANGCVSSSQAMSLDQYGIYDILFETNSDVVRPEYQKILDRAVSVLNDNKGMTLDLKGHTDERGSTEYNQDLAKRRAENTKSYLSSKGISADRLNIVAVGEVAPKYAGVTTESYAANRRVSLAIKN